MNPPKGIDPRVWAEAERIFNYVCPDVSAVEEIARAIQNATEYKREECAKIADPIHYEGRMSDYEKHAFDVRDVISQEIRNRSNTTRERNEGWMRKKYRV